MLKKISKGIALSLMCTFILTSSAYAAGDASITTYKLGARQDDSYFSTFKSSGWWNADKLSDN